LRPKLASAAALAKMLPKPGPLQTSTTTVGRSTHGNPGVRYSEPGMHVGLDPQGSMRRRTIARGREAEHAECQARTTPFPFF